MVHLVHRVQRLVEQRAVDLVVTTAARNLYASDRVGVVDRVALLIQLRIHQNRDLDGADLHERDTRVGLHRFFLRPLGFRLLSKYKGTSEIRP